MQRVNLGRKPDLGGFHLTYIRSVCTYVDMEVQHITPWQNPLLAQPPVQHSLQELIQALFHPKPLVAPLASPMPVQPGFFVAPTRIPRRRYTKEQWLERLTAEDLGKVSRELLLSALQAKGITFNVKEMAVLAKTDEETIRRRTKDGSIRKASGLRHIRVHYDVFFRWLKGESPKTT